jgi:uncharacterized membrane protein
MKPSTIGLLMLSACAGALPDAARAAYTITSFDVSGSTYTDIWDINNTGQFVGTTGDSVSEFGYVDDHGLVTRLLGPNGAVGTSASGISDGGGVVVGVYGTDSAQHGYVYQSGIYTNIDVPIAGASDTMPRGVSADGRYVVGTFINGATFESNGFVLDRTTGSYTVIGSGQTIAQGINGAGQIVGDTYVGDARTSFIYDLHSGAMSYFSLPGVNGSIARDINNNGQIAGWLQTSNGNLAWIGTTTSYQSIAVAGAVGGTVGEGLNDAGQVVGLWTDVEGNTHGFIATSVPEPGTLVLMVAGAFVVGGIGLRRRA